MLQVFVITCVTHQSKETPRPHPLTKGSWGTSGVPKAGYDLLISMLILVANRLTYKALNGQALSSSILKYPITKAEPCTLRCRLTGGPQGLQK